MNKLNLLLAYPLIIIIELIFPARLKISNIAPDLSLIFIVLISLCYGWRRGAVCGFLIGLLKDSFSASYFGKEAALFLLIGAFSGRLNDLIYKESGMANFIIVFLASIVVGIAFAPTLGRAAFIYVIYTSCLAPLVFKFLKQAA